MNELKALRKLRERTLPEFEDGTVVRWTSDKRYTYVALFIAALNRWYITGPAKFYGTCVLTPEQFAEIMQASGTGDIALATDWAEVER